MKALASGFICAMAMCAGLLACADRLERGVPHVAATVDVHSGEAAVSQLVRWYDDTTLNCGSATRPAFLCSGVLLRATDTNINFLPWDPSPNAIAKGGISVSWLRADMNFPSTFTPNGFILYPDYDIPAGKMELAILCAFPLDGNTWERPTLQGCGQHRSDPQSRPCQDLGITTAQGWINNYNAVPPQAHPTHSHQCGWDVREGSTATADRFNQNIHARALLSPQHWRFIDEIIIRTWPTGSGIRLPIQSFFYLAGNSTALANARNDRQRYLALYGTTLPIIRLTLPSSSAGRAIFEYVPGDQMTSTGTESPVSTRTVQ